MAASASKKSYGWNGDMVNYSLDSLFIGITRPAQHSIFNDFRNSLDEMASFLQ